MIEDFENQEEEVRSSGELWSEICSSLPEVQSETGPEEDTTDFTDSFRPATQQGAQSNGQANGTRTSSPRAEWKPMEDSEVYIAGLGMPLVSVFPCPLKDSITNSYRDAFLSVTQ